MDLLQHPEDRGYPREYLLARIRGRRARLITDWEPLLFDADPSDYLGSPRYRGFVRERSPEGLWRELVKEYRWVYFQSNERLRAIFRPYILYTELRTLFICLRGLKDRNAGRCGSLIDVSLLSPEIKEILLAGPDARAAVTFLEPVFLSLSSRFRGMAGIFETEGLRGVEQLIINTFFSVLADARLHPLMRAFFARLADTRNILRVYKQVRLALKSRVSLARGGTIPEARLLAILEKGDLSGLDSLIRRFSGMKTELPSDRSGVEVALYKGLTRFLKKEGRDPLGPGVILDYLWKCSVEVMNLSVLFACRELERETALAELVQ